MRRNLTILGALALLALACHRAPTKTAQQRAAMGPEILARLEKHHITVKAEITGPQSEHLLLSSPDIGDPTIETLAYWGINADFCAAGFADIELSDGQAWRKVWNC
jgi:hypothetical protein